MLNVLIADSHPAARAGLHLLVEHAAERLGDECLIAYSADAVTTLRKAKRLQPDLILLGASLRQTGGVQTVLALRAHAPRAKLVVLSHGEEDAVGAYVDAGADGVLHEREQRRTLEMRIGDILGELRRSASP
ncbi:MAG TPA: response regulator [Gammaproteobacteria bacterium]|nr:response regulator [Gammaproteobacteria bacterium]